MRKHVGLIVAVALVAFSTSGCWLQLGGNAGRTAFVSGETGLTSANASTLHQVWTKSVGTTASTAVIDDGKLFISNGPVMTALSAFDGSIVWQVNVQQDQYGPNLDAPTIINGQVSVPYSYAGTFGGSYTFDENTGANTSSGTGQAAPIFAAAVANGVVAQDIGEVSQGGVGVLLQYGPKTGFVYFGTLQQGAPRVSPPMLSGNFAFVSLNSSVLAFALDACPSGFVGYCGATWTANLPANADMPVALGASELAVPLAKGDVAVLDAATGATQWTAHTGSSSAQPPAVDGTNMYVGTNDGKVRAFPVAGCGQPTCNAAWTSSAAAGGISSQPVVAGGVVYVGSALGVLAGYDTTTGATLYSTNTALAGNKLSLIENAGTVYVTTNGGKIAAYRPS